MSKEQEMFECVEFGPKGHHSIIEKVEDFPPMHELIRFMKDHDGDGEVFEIRVFEMSKSDYLNLPEFEGF